MTHPAEERGAATYRVRVVTSAAELEAEKGPWHFLWDQCRGARTPYLSFEYVSTWVKHYGRDGRLYVVVVEDEGAIVGLVPLTIVRYGVGPFALEVLETVGGESRNRIALVAPGYDAAVARSVAEHLCHGVLSGRRILRLSLVPSSHPFLGAFVEALSSTTCHVRVGVRSVTIAPYVPLPAVWEDFVGSLGRRRRKYLGRLQRRLDGERMDVQVRSLTGGEVEEGMRHLFRLHGDRWRTVGIRGLFRDERSRAFHLELADECDRLGWLDLSTMTIDGVVVSAHLALVLDGVAYVMKSGRDTAFGDYGIGHLHDLRLFRGWIAGKLREADFLRGGEPYKFYWTRNYRVYSECVALRSIVPGWLSIPGVRVWMRIARFIAHRHPPAELLAYLRLRRMARRELSAMGIKIRR